MGLALYNTLSKKEEEFVPLKKGKVSMYTCGPTVYGRPHIGNYSSFLMADLLRRWLEVSGFTVTHVKNITDVGHLVADQDQGEDKIEKQAKAEKVDPLAIAKKYEAEYLADEHLLNMVEPEHRPRATETVKEMLQIIKILLQNGNAYELDDGIYFDVTTFPQYGALSGNKVSDLEAGSRVHIKEGKKHPADFALWKKTVGENSHHILRWSFASGERTSTEGDDPSSGFPGWHIECSAMAKKFLGEQLDIHTGGEDNIFPHHECEIAQSECSGAAPFVRYWLHKRRIEIALDGEESVKMSKSLGNILTLTDLQERGFDPLDVRYYLLSVHYRTNLQFSWKGLEDAKKSRHRIIEWMREVSEQAGKVGKERKVGKVGDAQLSFVQKFDDAMNSDLNTSAALAVVFDVMTLSRKESIDHDQLMTFIKKIQQTFGCFELTEENIPDDVMKLVTERERARTEKNFSESDLLRTKINDLGYDVKDTSSGPKVSRL